MDPILFFIINNLLLQIAIEILKEQFFRMQLQAAIDVIMHCTIMRLYLFYLSPIDYILSYI